MTSSFVKYVHTCTTVLDRITWYILPVIIIGVFYVLKVVPLLSVSVEVTVLEQIVGRVVGAGHLVLVRLEVRPVQGILSESVVGHP